MVDPARPAGAGIVGAVLGVPALALRGAIRVYRYTLSSLVGRTCRHLPTCSEYADEAIRMHGAWAGFWMGLARFWRCRPFGTHGFDPVPETLPDEACWFLPWRYGRWRGPLAAPTDRGGAGIE